MHLSITVKKHPSVHKRNNYVPIRQFVAHEYRLVTQEIQNCYIDIILAV